MLLFYYIFILYTLIFSLQIPEIFFHFPRCYMTYEWVQQKQTKKSYIAELQMKKTMSPSRAINQLLNQNAA